MKSITRYIIVAFGFTWAVAFAIIWGYRQGILDAGMRDLLHALPALGPAIGAWIVLPDHSYWRKRLAWQKTNRLSWWVVLSPLILFATGISIYGISHQQAFSWSEFASTNFTTPLQMTNFVLPLLTYGFFEEIGWRGFLLPHLQKRFSAWKATFILTLIWGLWHFPFFFYRFEFSLLISIGFFFGLWIGAILLTHLLNQNHGIIWYGILFHFLNNLASAFEKEVTVMVLSVGFMILALYLVQRFGRKDLASIPRFTGT